MRRLGLLICFSVLAAVPAPALADDQSVYDAWEYTKGPELTAAAKDHHAAGRAFARADRSNVNRRGRRVIRTARVLDRVLGARLPVIEAEASSTAIGEEAKGVALRSDRLWRRALGLKIRAIRSGYEGRPRAFRRGFRRAGRATKRSRRLFFKAYEKFREAGIETRTPGAEKR
jgi:hypothetical protein